MNYLAHAVLGGLDPEVALGNFIADAVKGSRFEGLPPGVVEGIRLHRAIDRFTDDHPSSVEARALLRPRLGRMAGVGLDLLYDHFLAREFERYSTYAAPLKAFSAELEDVLGRQQELMPERSARFFAAMRTHRWLSGYADRAAMQAVCEMMDRRVRWESGLGQTLSVLDQPSLHRALLHHFEALWRDLPTLLAPFPGESLAQSPAPRTL